MEKRVWDIFVASLWICLGLGSMSTVLGQDYDDTFILEEITVTAQKRSENQQKVPITMEVVSGEEIKDLGMNDVEDILSDVASVIINTASDGYRISIRGMSNDNGVFNGVQASTPTVALNTDGVYTNRNSGGQGLYDVDRVEVLYGPQSTLYASASPGGVVNIVTANPKLDMFKASASVEYGSFNLLHTEGSLNVPVAGQVALRAAISTSKQDGYLSNGANEEDKKSGRLKALYAPGDRLSIVLTGEYSETGGQGFAGVETFVDQDDKDDPWTASSAEAGLDTDQKNKKITAHIELDLGYAGTLSIVPSYTTFANDQKGVLTSSFMGNASTTFDVNTGEGHEKGGEIRMVSSADFPFKWIVGGNIYDSLDEQTQYSYEPDDHSTLTGSNYAENEQKTKSIYANVTYPIVDQFRTTVGVRQTWDENDSYVEAWPVMVGMSEDQDYEAQEYNEPNYKVGFEYDLAESSMVYADWSTSYRTQGMSFWSQQDMSALPPEELSAYTLGAKNRFFENKLQLNISAYYYDYENYFAVGDVHTSIVDENGNGVVDPGEGDERSDWWREAAKRVGDAKVYGFDLQTSSIISSKDKLDLSVSYMKKYFTDLFFDWADITNSMGLPDFDYSHKQMPNAPEWTANASYTHNFILGNGGSLDTRLDIRWQSEFVLSWQALQITQFDTPVDGQYYAISDYSEVREQEAYHMTDFSLTYKHPDGSWTLSAYVKNLEDYAVKRSLMRGTLMIGAPRTFGGVLSVDF